MAFNSLCRERIPIRGRHFLALTLALALVLFASFVSAQLRGLGVACTVWSQCGSSNCVDTVCCSAPCNGPCEACNITGKPGTCSFLGFGLDPSSECGGLDVCNGNGSCAPNNGVNCTNSSQCSSGNCVDGFCCDSSCSATCQSCNLAGKVGNCSFIPRGLDLDLECPVTEFCDGNGSCVSSNNGVTCSNSSECASGHCVDAVCCDLQCQGLCTSCNIQGSVGTCNFIPMGLDPDGECTSGSLCSGSGSCLKLNGATCLNPSDCLSSYCADSRCCTQVCDGVCQQCDLSGNMGACTSALQGTNPRNACPNNFTCDSNQNCIGPFGAPCQTGSECESTFCVDNVCCENSCSGTCMSCNVNGSLGSCINTPRGFPDPSTCVLPDSSCDGSGACLEANGRSCNLTSASLCASGLCSDGFCCDRDCSGACETCALINNVGRCSFVPANSPDPGCFFGEACDGSGKCLNLLGYPCAFGSECSSRFCANKVCCNSSCSSSPCQACNISAQIGICSNISLGSPSNGLCSTGLCDGSGSCFLIPTQVANLSNCINGSAGSLPGSVCIDGTFVVLDSLNITTDTVLSQGLFVSGNILIDLDRILSVATSTLFIDGSTLNIGTSANAIIKGNLFIGESSTTLLNAGQSANATLRVDGCAHLSGSLNIILNRDAANTGTLNLIDFGCIDSQYSSVSLTLDPSDSRTICSSVPKYSTSLLAVAYSIAPTCEVSLAPLFHVNPLLTFPLSLVALSDYLKIYESFEL